MYKNYLQKIKSKTFLIFIFLLHVKFSFSQTITSFTPTSGAVGSTVTLIGTNLGNPVSLAIGGVPAIVISNTGTNLVAMVMPGATTGVITINTGLGNFTANGNFTINSSQAPNSQQENKLLGTGSAGLSEQGLSVCVSADGNTAIIGGRKDSISIGAAWVYTRSGTSWNQQGYKLVGTGSIGVAQQGTSVSISADGNTAIIGGAGDNNFIGAAWIFIRNGNIWSQQGNKLVGSGAIGQSFQGQSVSISADGNTAIIGGSDDNNGVGAAWTYARSGSIWNQQGSKLVGTAAVGQAGQGKSVSISADGKTAIVGGPYDSNNVGAAWIYTRSGNSWNQQGNKLVGNGTIGSALQGTSVSISADGNTAIIGGYGDNNYIGAAWIFIRNGNAWNQQVNKLVGTGAVGQASQGQSVSISADGNTAIVGGREDNNGIGAAWIFTRSGGTWSQRGSKLSGTSAVGSSKQGTSVSISADGNTAIVGGSNDNNFTGAAWVFSYSAPTIISFTPTNGSVGSIVTVIGTNLYSPTSFTIGGVPALVLSKTDTSLLAMVMPGATTGVLTINIGSGNVTSVGTFTVSASQAPNSQQGNKLVGTGAFGSSSQGSSVSISADGNTAIVGGSTDNNRRGAAWVYTRSGISWSQQGNKLVGAGFSGFNDQGRSVSISADGNTAIVGAPSDDNNKGAAWVFTRIGNSWNNGVRLVGTGAVGAAMQGGSVSISADGNTAIVGGISDNNYVGAAWIYTRDGSTWNQQGNKLVGSGALGQSYQGQSVSISADGKTAIIGGNFDNVEIGATWVFTRSGNSWTQQGSKLVGIGTVGSARQGYSVALSADGNTAMVGGNWDNNLTGAVWVFNRNGGTWTQQGNKLVGTGSVGAAEQGYSISLSADGNSAIVGGVNDDNNKGAIWVFARNGNTWSQKGNKLVGADAIGAARQGYSISLSADGNTAIVGGVNDNINNIGAAWVFTAASPIITSGLLSTFTKCTGIVSSQQSFTVSGANLTDNIVVTPPTGFEVSTTSGTGYVNSISLTQTSGIVNPTTIYIRLNNTATGNLSGNIVCSSIGVASKIITISGLENVPTSSTTTKSVCFNTLPYLWNGRSYNEAKTDTVYFINSKGCDSLTILRLTIKSNSISITNKSICESSLPFTWNGKNYNATKTDTIILINSVGCDSLTILNLTVNPLPITSNITGLINVKRLDTTSYSVAGINGSVFNWIVTGASVQQGAGTNKIQVKWSTVGAQTVKVSETSNKGCIGLQKSISINVSPSIGINEIKRNNNVVIYPNPFNESLNINSLNNLVLDKVILYNLLGKEIVITNKNEMDTKDLKSGVYLIHIVDNLGNEYNQKIIKN